MSRFSNVVADAFRHVRRQRQRAILAVIGIAVGAAAVTALLGIGEGARKEAHQRLTAMGPDLATIQKSIDPSARMRSLQIDDANKLILEVPHVRDAAPIIQLAMQVSYGGRSSHVQVLGIDDAYPRLMPQTVASGRLLSKFDDRQPFAVLGHDAAKRLSEQGGPVKPGSHIRIGDANFTIVGILDYETPNTLLPVISNDAIMVPIRSVRRIADDVAVTVIVARLDNLVSPNAAITLIRRFFETQPQPIGVDTQTAQQLASVIDSQMEIYRLLLAGTATISLLLGGLGVMNVMLSAVSERRQEIGLRVALGARQVDILAMMLVEAVVLSLLGGVLGLVVGVVTAWLSTMMAGWPYVFSPISFLGIGISLAVGSLFGLYPASRASRLDPIVALRAA